MKSILLKDIAEKIGQKHCFHLSLKYNNGLSNLQSLLYDDDEYLFSCKIEKLYIDFKSISHKKNIFESYVDCVTYSIEKIEEYERELRNTIDQCIKQKKSIFTYKARKQFYIYHINMCEKLISLLIHTRKLLLQSIINQDNKSIDILYNDDYILNVRDDFEIDRNFYFVYRMRNQVFFLKQKIKGIELHNSKYFLYFEILYNDDRNHYINHTIHFDKNGNIYIHDLQFQNYLFTYDYEEAKKYAQNLKENILEEVLNDIKIVEVL